MANVALDRALASDPAHPMAGLLRTALDSCMRPADVRAMIVSCISDLPDRDDPIGVADLFDLDLHPDSDGDDRSGGGAR